jgi:cytochrome c-type biogenesis protein CcmE
MTNVAWDESVKDNHAVAVGNWEKPIDPERARLLKKSSGRWKFLIGGVLILASIGYLVITSTLTGARFFITVDEVVANPKYLGDTVRISGAVIGSTIQQEFVTVDNNEKTAITFTISNIPDKFDNLADALHESVTDPNATRLPVYYEGDMPNLLQHEAQAILTGTLGPDGVFHATELLLKCPSRFQDGGSNPELGASHQGIEEIDFNAG